MLPLCSVCTRSVKREWRYHYVRMIYLRDFSSSLRVWFQGEGIRPCYYFVVIATISARGCVTATLNLLATETEKRPLRDALCRGIVWRYSLLPFCVTDI